MNSLANIVNEIKLVAEGSNDHGTTVQYAAWYYGFHPLVSWVLTESVRAPLRPNKLREACKALTLNHDEDLYSNFWRAYARIQLGQLEMAGSAERQAMFDWAKRNADDGVIKERPLDRRYILCSIQLSELGAGALTASGCEKLRLLALEMIEAGDFDTPSILQRYLTETYPGEEYLELGPSALNLVLRCQARVNGLDCYYSKVQLTALQKYVKKKFGI